MAVVINATLGNKGREEWVCYVQAREKHRKRVAIPKSFFIVANNLFL